MSSSSSSADYELDAEDLYDSNDIPAMDTDETSPPPLNRQKRMRSDEDTEPRAKRPKDEAKDPGAIFDSVMPLSLTNFAPLDGPTTAVVSKPVESVEGNRFITPEAFCMGYLGASGKHKIYYAALDLQTRMKINFFDAGPRARANAVEWLDKDKERKEAARTWTETDGTNYAAKKAREHLLCRKVSLTTAGKFCQVDIRELKPIVLEGFVEKKSDYDSGYKKDKKKSDKVWGFYLFGVKLSSRPNFMYMTPPMVAGCVGLGIDGALKKDIPVSRDLKKVHCRLCLTDEPILSDKGHPGFSEKSYNTHAAKYFDWAKGVFEPSVMKQIWAHENCAEHVKSKAKTAAKSDLIDKLKAERKYKTAQDAAVAMQKFYPDIQVGSDAFEQKKLDLLEKKRFEDDSEVREYMNEHPEGQNMLQAAIKDAYKSFQHDSLVQVPDYIHDELGSRTCKTSWFKRDIMTMVKDHTGRAQAEVMHRLHTGAYSHLPQRYQEFISQQKGEYDYDGVLVFIMKTKAESTGDGPYNLKVHNYPVRELSWAERENLQGKKHVFSVITEVQISEDSKGVGPKDNRLVAVLIWNSEDLRPEFQGGKNQSSQWDNQPCFFG